MHELLKQKSWRFIDQSISNQDENPLVSFAMDDTLCQLVGQLQSPPIVRTWVHKNTVVLGIQDHRLPYVQDGLAFLAQNHYKSIVRNSGGLAVVLDEGVLNISIVVSEKEANISIKDGYEMMFQFIKMLFPEVSHKIEAYEIVGSYCPGSYDLSINGKKFAGISQRRIRDGIAVQIYLCIEGSGSRRAELIKTFYEVSLKNVETKFQYPNINPKVMASLSELLNDEITVQDTVFRVQQLLQSVSENVIYQPLNMEETELYAFYLNRVLERNKKLLSKNK